MWSILKTRSDTVKTLKVWLGADISFGRTADALLCSDFTTCVVVSCSFLARLIKNYLFYFISAIEDFV